MKNSIYNFEDTIDAFFESMEFNKKSLKENTDDGICALIALAGGAQAIAASCKKNSKCT